MLTNSIDGGNCYNIGELFSFRATKRRSAFDEMLFLKEVLKKCTNRQTFVVDDVSIIQVCC
ncbi:MAG: hypothetical protein ACP5GS_02345 [Nitrososphaeria archaeon]|jgi:transposase-like protein